MNDQDRPHESYRPPESQDDLNKPCVKNMDMSSSYPVTDNELVGTPFYRRPQFYLHHFLFALIAILLAIIIASHLTLVRLERIKPLITMRQFNISRRTTDQRLSPES